ncbi:MAG: hypothetical protein ACKVX7_10420 [Planctomycetota bacterium]
MASKRCSTWLCSAIVLGTALPVYAQSAEFTAASEGAVRIECEYKLAVPEAIVEDVWRYLTTRYADAAFLDYDDRRFQATLSREVFTDVYFDEPTLTLLAMECGVRHRSRQVDAGGAKDGRQLLQLKLRGDDSTGLARNEIKFKVDPPKSLKEDEDSHAVLGLLARADRPQFKKLVAEVGVDPFALERILTLEQVRRRVYLADQDGAFATLTLDQPRSTDFGRDVGFTEIELELNEIRYTEADAAGRARMHAVNDRIKRDLEARFPGIVPDQTPKYNKIFARLESGWLPLRFLIAHDLSPSDVVASLLFFALVLPALAGVWLFGRRRRARSGRPAHERPNRERDMHETGAGSPAERAQECTLHRR